MSSVIKLKNKPLNLKTDLGEEFSFEAEREAETQIIQKQEYQKNYEKAFSDGYENAKRDMQNELDNQLIKKSEEFYSILASFESKLAEYDSSLPEIISKVSIMIAEKIVAAQLENKPIINDTIKKAVQKIIGTSEILLKINPLDFELINSSKSLNYLDNSNTKVKFEISDKISQGGCLIESNIGNVDARISSQFEEMSRTFRNNLENTNS
jgi:flagellar assembly protein FliH